MNALFLSQDKGVKEIYFHHTCGNSVYFLVFFGLSVAYKILLNAAGLVFAILIRNVKIDVLNDSQETVAMIVVSGVLQLAAVPVLIIISRSVNTLTLAWSIIIFFIAMSHLTLIFIPKVCSVITSITYHIEDLYNHTGGCIIQRPTRRKSV